MVAASPAREATWTGRLQGRRSSSFRTGVTVGVGDLAVLMELPEDRIIGLADDGALPARLGSKGLTFDLNDVHRRLSRPSSRSGFSVPGSLLRDLSLRLASAENPSDVFERATSYLVDTFRAHCGVAFVTDADAWLLPACTVGYLVQDRAEALQRVAAWVAIERRPVCVGIPREAADIAPRSTYVGAIPVLWGERICGVIALQGRSGAAVLDAEQLAAAESVAAQVGMALERIATADELAAIRTRNDLNQRQMEAFARDVRATFAAEKDRAHQLAEALEELQKTYLATVKGLAVAVEAKDEYTAGHLQRVTRYGLAMMRIVAPDEANDPQYEYGFLLHDVGKMAVPDAVLKKEGPLTEDEWVVMRTHAEVGGRILHDIPFLVQAREIVCAHHERWDGKGYPHGLKGEEIPLGARVFAIADAFDAMRSDRPYRTALPTEVAIAELEKGSGSQFWPAGIAAFLRIPLPELEALASKPFVLEGLR